MTLYAAILKIIFREDINFLLTNRIPRRWATLFIGWFSKIEQPFIRDVSIGLWKRFADLRLDEAKKEKFVSLHDCFIRELAAGVRPVDPAPDIFTSPCDGIVGACGLIDGIHIFQAKGFPYTLLDLLGDPELVNHYRNGSYATIRITSSMYHRFHAPLDCEVRQVDYISGDTWNVNPIALARVEKLFCKNERAVIHVDVPRIAQRILLVPVAAILVASIRLHFINVLLHIRYRGANRIFCNAKFKKGEEMGWFQHGSTIIVLAPCGFSMCDEMTENKPIRMGERLMKIPVIDLNKCEPENQYDYLQTKTYS